jgi:hypothetical protein
MAAWCGLAEVPALSVGETLVIIGTIGGVYGAAQMRVALVHELLVSTAACRVKGHYFTAECCRTEISQSIPLLCFAGCRSLPRRGEQIRRVEGPYQDQEAVAITSGNNFIIASIKLCTNRQYDR